MIKMNPRTFVLDAIKCGAGNLPDLIARMGVQPGLRRRDPQKYAQRWAHKLGLLGRWRREERAKIKARQEAELVEQQRREADSSGVREAALATLTTAPILLAVPAAAGMLEIASTFIMPDDAPKPRLSRKERRDIQFGRVPKSAQP